MRRHILSLICVSLGWNSALEAQVVSPVPIKTFEYDANGNRTRVIQAPGVTGFGFRTTATYDALNLQKDETNARNGITRYAYDGRKRLTQVTDPRSLTTNHSRDGLGNITQVSSPDAGVVSLTYDTAGNIRTRTDARGAIAQFQYDSLNRMTGAVYSRTGFASMSFGWSYDQSGPGYGAGIGRVTSMQYPSGTAQLEYDAAGNVIGLTQMIHPTSGGNESEVSSAIRYIYDAAGLLQEIVYPSGRRVILTRFGGLPRDIAVARDASSTPTQLVSSIEWTSFGSLKSFNWAVNGTFTPHEFVYDSSGRVVRTRLGDLIRDAEYDAADRLKNFTHYSAASGLPAPSYDQTFSYDELGRVTAVVGSAASWSFAYDGNGNRSSVVLNGVSRSYTTSATSNKLTSISNPVRAISYDEAGSVVSDGLRSSSFDSSGRLSSTTAAAGTTLYTYNAMGMRVRKVASANTVIYVHDLQGRLMGEYDRYGAAIREYVWLGDLPLAIMDVPATTGADPTFYFIHADHLGTPRAVLNGNGQLRWAWYSDAFGVSAPSENPSGLGAFVFNLRFPGQYYDVESGLHHNRFRDYDPTIGRYIESDPLGVAAGVNTYSYVGSNPLAYSDPSGLICVPCVGIGAGLGVLAAVAPLIANNTPVGQIIGAGVVGGLAGAIGGLSGGIVGSGAVAVTVGSYMAGLLGNAAGQATTTGIASGSPSIDWGQACVQGTMSMVGGSIGSVFAASASTPLRVGVFEITNSTLIQTVLNMSVPERLGGFLPSPTPPPAPPPPWPPIAEGSSSQGIVDGGYVPYDAALDMTGP